MDIRNCKWDVSRTSPPLPAKEVHWWNNNVFEGEGWIGKKDNKFQNVNVNPKSRYHQRDVRWTSTQLTALAGPPVV